jgi:hypothetical protein
VYHDHVVEKYIIKIGEDIPEETLPIHSPNFTGSITGLMYHAIGLASVLVIGIEISIGFDKSTLKFSIVAIIIFFTAKGTKIYAKITNSLPFAFNSFYSNLQKIRSYPISQNFPFLWVSKYRFNQSTSSLKIACFIK